MGQRDRRDWIMPFRRLIVLGALGLSACGEQPVQKGEAALKDRLARKDLQDRQVPLGRAGPSSVL